MKKKIVLGLKLTVILALLITFTGCYATHTIPAGYVAKILTPSGFDKAILSPGQVNLGIKSWAGRQSRMVLLEATTVTVVEQFRDAANSSDRQDHRIMTKDGVPTVVDMYVRLTLPDDQEIRNQIFLQITPEPTDDPLETKITLMSIYAKFVEMDIRNKTRDILTKYENFQDVLANYSRVNNEVAAAAIKAFKDSNVPLKLQDAQLSQVLPDPQVWDSEVKKKSAEALKSQIFDLGSSIASNPAYLEYLKWQALQNIAEKGSASGTNTLIIVDGGKPIDVTPWAAGQNIINQLKTPAPAGVPTPKSTGTPILPASTPTPTPKK